MRHHAEISTRSYQGRKVLEVDVSKSKYFDTPWKELSEFQKKKFENAIYLENTEGTPIIIFSDNGRRMKVINA